MKQKKISHKYLDVLKCRASRLSQYPDEQYKKIFEEYTMNGQRIKMLKKHLQY